MPAICSPSAVLFKRTSVSTVHALPFTRPAGMAVHAIGALFRTLHISMLAAAEKSSSSLTASNVMFPRAALGISSRMAGGREASSNEVMTAAWEAVITANGRRIRERLFFMAGGEDHPGRSPVEFWLKLTRLRQVW